VPRATREETDRVRTADIVCGVFLVVVAMVVAIEGLRLGVGWGTDGPRPGFFVFYLGVALLAAAALVVIGAIRRPAPSGHFATGPQVRSVVTVFWPAVVMVILTHFLGLYVTGALYLAGYMRWIGRHRWITTVLVAVGIPVVTFLIFEIWFLVPLPKGPFETRLGY
jgi:putative tricarboxylic transport membrane protein